jgi:hypothetical protein
VRKYNRFYSDDSIPIAYKVKPGTDIGYLHDISNDGLSFISDNNLSAGDIISIEIPSTKPLLNTKASVIWSQNKGSFYNTGVKFIEIQNGSAIRLVEVIRFLNQRKRNMFLSKHKKLSCEQIYSQISTGK